MDERRVGRRGYLGACGAGLLSLLAGCPGDVGNGTETGAPSTPTVTDTSAATATPSGTGTPTATATEVSEEAHRWRVETDFPVLLEPAAEDGTLYAVESAAELARPTGTPTDHSLLALSTDDGTERWRIGLGAPAGDAPLVADGQVFASAGFSTGFTGVDYRVVAADRETGERAWTFENQDPDQFVSLVAAADGVLLVGRNDDAVGPTEAFVSGIDVRSGEERWRYETGDAWSGAADGNSFYVGSPAGVYAFTARDGTARWLYADAALAPESIAANGRVYLAGDTTLASVDPGSGRLRWRVDTDEAFVTDRLVTDEFVAVGTFDGWVRSVDALTGAGNWARRVGSTVWSVGRRDDGSLVVVATAPGSDPARIGREAARIVYLVDERTGETRERLPLAPGEQVAVAGQTIYVWDAAGGAVAALAPGIEVRWGVDLGVEIRTLLATADAAYVSTADDALLALGT